MATITWVNVGQLMTSSFSESPAPNVFRSEFESNDIKQTRRSSTRRVSREITYFFTAAEYATFKTWFQATAEDGALYFDFTDPVDNVLKDFRIINGVYTATPVTIDLTHYYVSMQMETVE